MKFLLIILWQFMTLTCFAQLPKYYVYTLIGKAVVQKEGKRISINKGSLLYDKDTITLAKSSKMTLLDYDNKFITLDKPGTYKYDDLKRKLTSKSTGITASYLHFLWEDLFKPNVGNKPKPSQVIGGVTGGAKRGECDEIMLDPVNNSKLIDDTVYFSWKPVPGATLYVLKLKDAAANDKLNILVKDTSLAILRKDLLEGQTTSFLWRIDTDVDSNTCNFLNSFTVTSLAEKKRETELLINKVPKDSDTFLYNLQVSNSLVNNGWYNEAAEYYEKAKQVLQAKSF